MGSEHAKEKRTRAMRSVVALRTPDASLRTVPNTVRQSIADVIEEQDQKLDRYGLALMMIREGCENPRDVAARALKIHQGGDRG